MGNSTAMTFAELVESAGGPSEIAKGAAVSRSHLANIAAGRKRLTPDVVAAIRPLFPHVAEGWWLARLLDQPAHETEGATDAA